MPETTHYKVLAAPAEFCTHRGDILQLSAEKAAEYAEKGEYFRLATPEEVAAHLKAQETATAPSAPESAVLSDATTKTPEEAAKMLQNAQKEAKK